MNTIEEQVAKQKVRDEDVVREQKVRDEALIADLSHAKDKAEEDRLKKRHADETAAAQAKRDEADRVAARG